MAMIVSSLFSVAVHSGLLAAVLLVLGQPKQFDTPPPDAIAVELVTPKEVAETESKPEIPEAESLAAERQSSAAPEPQHASEPSQEITSQHDTTAAASQPAVNPPAPLQQLPAPSSELLAFYNMRAPGSNFDAPADTKAQLTDDEVKRFRSHLRRCWRVSPELAASGARVVLRIFLREDGALAREPILIEAPASREGPQVMQAAMRAVEDCQPFAFLPRERYEEWRQLDLGFSPREMGG